MEPWEYREEQCTDTLCLSSRDFLVYLEQFLRENCYSRTEVANKDMSLLVEVLELDDSMEKVQISG